MQIEQELFYQLQYWVNKYFFFITLSQIFLFMAPFLLLKFSDRLNKFIQITVITFFSGIYFIKIIRYLDLTKGWDRNAICSWISLDNEFTDYDIYTLQLQNSLDFQAPVFSFYYHPVLLKKFEFFCTFSDKAFNYIVVSTLIFIAIYLSTLLKNVSRISIVILTFFSFNNLLWLLITGQFFFLEIITLVVSLTLLKYKKHKLAIIFLFIFGVQKIYFLVFSFYLAIKYFKWKGLTLFTFLIILVNLITLDMFQEFITFWLSSEGYLFGDRGDKHSFLQENFGLTNQSVLFVLKDLLNILNISFNSISLIICVALLSLIIIYFLHKKLNDYTSNKITDLFVFLSFLLAYPLLKPYAYIYFSIILLFLLHELNSLKLENLSLQLLTIPGSLYLLISDFLFNDTKELTNLLKIQYEFIMLYNFISSWIILIYLCRIVFLGKLKNFS